jgi:uncharacterized membrane protein YgcG
MSPQTRDLRTPTLSSLIAALLLLQVPAATLAAPVQDGSPPSAQNVYDEIETISQWYRYLDTSGHREAERYIIDFMEDLGLDVTVQEYTASRRDGPVRAANVLGMLEGVDPTRCLVIGGHYDANEKSTQGAYDNGAGVGCVLELARWFTEETDGPPPISMLFATWDSEEGGGAGSRHYVENPVWDVDTVAYINLDMFALNYPVRNRIPMADEEYYKLNVYTSPVSDFSIYDRSSYDDATLANFSHFRDTLEAIAYDELAYPRQWVIVMDDTAGISDHRVFVQSGVPAVWLRGLNERPRDEGDLNEIAFKHTPIDRLETMEQYAGGRSELLKGIDAGLGLAHRLAEDLLEYHNTTSDQSSQDASGGGGGSGSGSSGGAGAALGLLVVVGAAVLLLARGRARGA